MHSSGELLTVIVVVVSIIGLVLGVSWRGWLKHEALRKELERQVRDLERSQSERTGKLHERINNTREDYITKEDCYRLVHGLGKEMKDLRIEVRTGFSEIQKRIDNLPEKMQDMVEACRASFGAAVLDIHRRGK